MARRTLSAADKHTIRDLIAAMVLSDNPSQRTRQAFHRGYVQGLIAATSRCEGEHGERLVAIAKRAYRDRHVFAERSRLSVLPDPLPDPDPK